MKDERPVAGWASTCGASAEAGPAAASAASAASVCASGSRRCSSADERRHAGSASTIPSAYAYVRKWTEPYGLARNEAHGAKPMRQ